MTKSHGAFVGPNIDDQLVILLIRHGQIGFKLAEGSVPSLVQIIAAGRDLDQADIAAVDGLRFRRPMFCGSCKSMFCSSNGRVMTKMINNTNAKSSSGVMLISLSVTSELRWENRLILP